MRAGHPPHNPPRSGARRGALIPPSARLRALQFAGVPEPSSLRLLLLIPFGVWQRSFVLQQPRSGVNAHRPICPRTASVTGGAGICAGHIGGQRTGWFENAQSSVVFARNANSSVNVACARVGTCLRGSGSLSASGTSHERGRCPILVLAGCGRSSDVHPEIATIRSYTLS